VILEHEIPKGARLYFGKSARQKRELESVLSEMLLKSGFEEIVTPNFSYGQHQSIDDVKKLIKIFDEDNNEVALRADSTLDVVRIITKRTRDVLQIIKNGFMCNLFLTIHQTSTIR